MKTTIYGVCTFARVRIYGLRTITVLPPGTGTPGYWKNYPEAWPVEKITIGGETYTMEEAVDLMGHSASNDVTCILFQALV